MAKAPKAPKAPETAIEAAIENQEVSEFDPAKNISDARNEGFKRGLEEASQSNTEQE